ncbi:hypothetical protein QTP88_027504 [Uroleucon formosanum]
MSNNFHIVRNIGAASDAAAGPSVAKLIQKFESMSTTADARPLRGCLLVSKLVEKYELLSCSVVSRPLRSKSTTRGGEGGKGGKGVPVATKKFFLARYYNRCGIELASLETCSEYRHSSCGFRNALTAPGTTTTTSEVPYTSTMIVVTNAAVSSSYTGSDNLYKTAPNGRQ